MDWEKKFFVKTWDEQLKLVLEIRVGLKVDSQILKIWKVQILFQKQSKEFQGSKKNQVVKLNAEFLSFSQCF